MEGDMKINFTEEIIQSLEGKGIKVERFFYQDLLRGSFYYPASGLDFKILDKFNKKCSSFIFADYTFLEDELNRAIKERDFLRQYEVVFMGKFNAEQIPGYEYIFGRTKEYISLLKGDAVPSLNENDLIVCKNEFEKGYDFANKRVNSCVQRNEFYSIIFMKKGNILPLNSDKQYANFISLIVLSADAICAFEGIYNFNKTHPQYMFMKKCGTGLSGGYTNLVKKGGVFEHVVKKDGNNPSYLAFSTWNGFGDGKYYETCFEPTYTHFKREFDYNDSFVNNHIKVWQGKFRAKYDFIIDYEKLEHIKGTTLFYPCSGDDYLPPILLFAPIIDNFWFVDCNYFCSENLDVCQENEITKDAQKWGNILQKLKEFEYIESKIIGKPNWDLSNRDIEPCILTQTYLHKPTNREIKLHFRRGYGYSAFDNEPLDPLGVFYYRGDGMGEDNSSSDMWLRIHSRDKDCRFSMVTRRLVEGGLLVTDGSNPDAGKGNGNLLRGSQRHSVLWDYVADEGFVDINAVLAENRSFRDVDNNKFDCIGFAGNRMGPTFIWQVDKNN